MMGMRIISRSVFSGLLIFLTGWLHAQTSPVISGPDVVLRNDSLIVRYAIQHCRQDQVFLVRLDVTTGEGRKILPHSLSGDVGPGVRCGGEKQIVWDMAADSLSSDKDVYVKVIAETDVVVPSGTGKENAKYLFASFLFPGAGLNLKTNSNKPYYLMGVAGYLGVATTLYFDQMKRKAYRDWQVETDAVKKDAFYRDYRDNRKYMIASAATTGTVWLVNLVWTLVAPEAEPAKITLGKGRNLFFSTTVLRENFTPALSLTCNF